MGQDTEANQGPQGHNPSRIGTEDDQKTKPDSGPDPVFEPKSPFIVGDEDLPQWSRQTGPSLPETSPEYLSDSMQSTKFSESTHKTDTLTSRREKRASNDIEAERDAVSVSTGASASAGDYVGASTSSERVQSTSEAMTGTTEMRLSDETTDDLLSAARHLIRNGKIEVALGRYVRLTRSSAVLEDVISDLEDIRREQDQSSPMLLQTLGDAYMKNNRIEKALELYRQASKDIKE